MIGMTAGAPLGSFVAARLFRLGIAPQVILQVAAALLAVERRCSTCGSTRRETRRTAAPRRWTRRPAGSGSCSATATCG